MTVADLVAMSWTNLTRRKGRTALTAAGVIVGVAALVLMISLGLGLQLEVLKIFESEQELRALHVSRPATEGRDRSSSFNLFGALGSQVLPITEKDLSDMAAIPGVERALPDLEMFLRFKVETSSGTRTIPFGPVGAAYPEEEAKYRSALVAGSMWRTREESACLLPRQFIEIRLQVAPADVLGKSVTFFASNAEDKESAPEALVYTCVGVFDAEKIGIKGRKIVLPASRAEDLRDRVRGGGFYPVPYKKGTYASATVLLTDSKQIEPVRGRLKGMGFEVISTLEIIKSINLFFLIVEGFLGCIGAIGLVVSLFGIANTMAMAVLERTREIGIMKALGARNRDIGRLFLAEAAAIGALGGAVGLGFAFLTGKLLNWLARGALNLPAGMNLFHVSLWLAAGSVAFSVFVSVLAGSVPARRAARMDPVRSLRYE